MDDTKAQQMIDRMRADREPGEPRPQPDVHALILALWARNEDLQARVASLEAAQAARFSKIG
ncbi:hypothetical protein FHP25_31305 [Vineibacter terrae]|uniref:Uncharacterized protein n=1 Tax=Vineibacter terrae TaxID=2586908 RepID=A0A5C8PBX1_9HYPH|nr:hypothetical protein [Vineibacter terrae]TXL71198.1 hypothetical protein FHP25_31305 [Vineibacter terrae]